MLMKKNIYMILSLVLIFSYSIDLYSAKKKSPANNPNANKVTNNKKGAWVAKIEGEPISLKDFNIKFEYYLKSKFSRNPLNPGMIPEARNNMEERKTALNDLIHERLLLKEAKKMKIHEKENIKKMIKLYNQQIIINAYIEQNLAGSINVEDQAIADYYEKNRDKFMGADPDRVRALIKRELSMKQYEIKLKEIIDKLRDKYRIDKNENAIRPPVNTEAPNDREDKSTDNPGSVGENETLETK